jgi:hypothetical protein
MAPAAIALTTMTIDQYHYTQDELKDVTVDDLHRLAGQNYFNAVFQGDGEGGLIITIETNDAHEDQ